MYETTYTFLWRSLLRNGKISEALFAADRGRAQTLYDNLMIRYGLALPLSCATFDSKETTIRLFTELSSQIIFLGLEGLKINIWFLSRGQKVAFRQGTLEADITEQDPIRALLQAALRKIGAEVEVRCEDRTFDEFDSERSSSSEVCEEVEKPSIECHQNDLEIAKEIGALAGEGEAYGNLGYAYFSLGDFRKAIEYHEQRLKIAKEIGHRPGEGRAYGNIGLAYKSLGDCRKAIKYQEKHLKIANEIGDRLGEGGAYANLGNVYNLLGDFQKALEYHEKHLKIAKEIGDRAGEGKAYGNLAASYRSLSDLRKVIEYSEKDLKIAKDTGDSVGEAEAYHNFGITYFNLGQFDIAVDNFVSAVDVLNT
ncbi:PREDICTED: G-protein-signaling modulator 2-like, partial [Acropora digitifera]|uniref:G-protein-signaling modulator 2-like n=1 Tax=Acropora digitifera TaxID=70779 RepID=UPI00077B1BBC